MKKITLLLSLLAISIGFGQELLSDGNLENTDSMNGGQALGVLPATGAIWTTAQASGQPSINSNPAVAHSGDNFINLGNDFKSFRQSFTATPATEYTVTVWNQYVSGGGQPEATDGTYISIRQDTGGNGTQFDPVIQYYIDPSTIDANWHEFTFNFTASQSNLLIYVGKQTRANAGPNNAARMDDFSIAPSLSISDLAQFNFSASPNPAKDYINLSASKNIDKVEIYNLLGQQIRSETLNNRQCKVNVESLSNGIYIAKAFIEDAVGSYKFIKE